MYQIVVQCYCYTRGRISIVVGRHGSHVCDRDRYQPFYGGFHLNAHDGHACGLVSVNTGGWKTFTFKIEEYLECLYYMLSQCNNGTPKAQDLPSFSQVLHIHCRHGDGDFSKFSFFEHHYDHVDISKLDLNVVKDYAMMLAVSTWRGLSRNLDQAMQKEL